MQTAPSINLVKDKKPHLLDQFIQWSLTIGRVVVILTEVVALGAFLYRFGLDRQLIDLHDKIEQEQNIIKFLKKSEDTYRALQDRISLASTLSKNSTQTVTTYKTITSLFPSTMAIKSFSYSQDGVKIEATVQSPATLSTFLDTVKQSPIISSVSLDKIENKTSLNLIAVSITIQLKGAGKKHI